MQQQINLYHPIFRRQEKKFSAKAMLQASAAVVAGILLMYVYSAWQLNSLRAQSTQIDREIAASGTQLSQIGAQIASRPADPALIQEISRLEAMVDIGQRLRALLKTEEFANSQGFSHHLVAFARQHVSGVWLTGMSIYGNGSDLTIEGRTYDPELVPKYLHQLTAEKALAGALFQTFTMNRPQDKNGTSANFVEFQVKTSATERKAATPDKKAKTP